MSECGNRLPSKKWEQQKLGNEADTWIMRQKESVVATEKVRDRER